MDTPVLYPVLRLGEVLFSSFLDADAQQRASKRRHLSLGVPVVGMTKMLARYFYFSFTD